MKIVIGAALDGGAASSCTSILYSVVQKGEHQIQGHPYKTADNCERRAPIGTFDRRCDIPLAGFRNFSDPNISVNGGGSVGGWVLAACNEPAESEVHDRGTGARRNSSQGSHFATAGGARSHPWVFFTSITEMPHNWSGG